MKIRLYVKLLLETQPNCQEFNLSVVWRKILSNFDHVTYLEHFKWVDFNIGADCNCVRAYRHVCGLNLYQATMNDSQEELRWRSGKWSCESMQVDLVRCKAKVVCNNP